MRIISAVDLRNDWEGIVEALRRAQEITARDPDYPQKTATYLMELREDQAARGKRSL